MKNRPEMDPLTQRPGESAEVYGKRVAEYYKKKAAEDMAAAGFEFPKQVGNNLYFLFRCHLDEKYGRELAPDISYSLIRMKRLYPEQWQSFLNKTKNKKLLQDMEPLLDQVTTNNVTAAAKRAAWDKLNPLLEKAIEALRAENIEPEKFFS